MELGYDRQKNARNVRERGLAFDSEASLGWGAAIIRQDLRWDYGEDRFQALLRGPDGKPYVVVFTMRGEMMWVISFRRAGDRESRRYGKQARSLPDRR